MRWDFFTTPTGVALLATLGSFVAGLIGPLLTSWTMRTTHSQRIAADEKLAKNKFEFERELAQSKLNADIALAEKKFQLDARLADRKRRQDLAEEVLEGFYKIRDVIREVRVPMSFQEEAAARKSTEPESEAVAHQRNTYYAPLARLDANRSEIAALLAKRYRTAAWFGASAEEPFQDVHETLTAIARASQMLMHGVRDGARQADPAFYRGLERDIWALPPNDPIAAKVDKAITKIEGICRPVLEGQSA
jgi:hypothetical protein